jgi:hypothetical protein
MSVTVFLGAWQIIVLNIGAFFKLAINKLHFNMIANKVDFKKFNINK